MICAPISGLNVDQKVGESHSAATAPRVPRPSEMLEAFTPGTDAAARLAGDQSSSSRPCLPPQRLPADLLAPLSVTLLAGGNFARIGFHDSQVNGH